MEKEQDNTLPSLNVLVTRTEEGFRSYVYHKSTFTGQYLNFNSHHPYNVKNGIVHCFQHWAKAISSDMDAYKEKMINLRHKLHRNNYLDRITSAPRNLDRRIEDDTPKLTTVCLPYVKAKGSKGYADHMTSGLYSKWLNSLLYHAANRIRHDQELCVLLPL